MSSATAQKHESEMADSFPIQKQTVVNWCWAAVALSVERYFSPDSTMTQCELAELLLKDARACQDPLPEDLDKAEELQLALRGVHALRSSRLGEPLPFEDVRSQIIDSRLPVCVRIQWTGENRAHCVVICGCSTTASREHWLDIADPYYGFSTLPYDEFLHAYQGSGVWTDSFLVKQPPSRHHQTSSGGTHAAH